MLRTNMWLGAYLACTSLCTFFVMTNSRTSTMWKLNAETGKIQTLDIIDRHIKSYSALDEDLLYNFNAMAEVYSSDEMFFTIVSSTKIDDHKGGWLRHSVENTLDSLLETRKVKAEANLMEKTRKRNIPKAKTHHMGSKVSVRSSSDNGETLDCGQPVNYTHYDYIINLGASYKNRQTQLMPEPEVIYFFLHTHDQEAYNNFNIEVLEKRLRRFKKQNPISAELYHHLGNYWRIIGDPVQAIKCFRRSLDVSPSSSEVMYDLAKVLFNIQYLDDAIHMARRSIEFQSSPFTAWRQYLLLGDILKTYGDLRGSVHYYRLALELNPTHEHILRSLNEVENKPSATLHVYTIVIIVTLVVMVLIVIVSSMIIEVRSDQQFINNNFGNTSDANDIKRHFNRALAMRSLKGLPMTTRSTRHRKY